VGPLVITATPNISWLHPEIGYPRTPDEFALEARRCQDAGAAVLHTHAEGQWRAVIDAVRATSDVIVQCGMSSLPIPERVGLFEAGADMASIILSHHDESFAEVECLVLHPREELEEYVALCSRYEVVPEWEVWHTGSIWNLRYLLDRQLLRPPHVVTMFFGWPGGTWSPPTVEEYQYRRRLLPEECVATVSIMGQHQIDVVAAAIVAGDHVRVGTEDLPFNRAGAPAATHELVAEAARLADALGRPIATVAEARMMLGVRGKPS
jgi:3-keto-5-aminohexanoate cleavage enzyme